MPGLQPKDQDIEQFVAITQASPEDARRFLTDGVTLEGAIEDYFAAQAAGGGHAFEEDEEDELDAALAASATDANPTPAVAPAASAIGGGRTLSGAPAEALPAGWGRGSAPREGRIGHWGGQGTGRGAAPSGRIATLRDSEQPEHDEDEDDQDRREGNELYTGGERSGLAVQNPDDERRPGNLVDDILQRARQNAPVNLDAPPPPRDPWGGVGHTLGSEDTPSVQVGGRQQRDNVGQMPGSFGGDHGEYDDEEGDEEGGELVQRNLTLWRDGFSIEDGELYRYDDPKSQELLAAINNNVAPMSLFNVRFGQQLQVVLVERRGEDYRAPPKKPFSGGGQRLGSASSEATGSGSSAAARPAPAASSSAVPPPALKVDESKPTTSIQIRLGDGTRIVTRVNLDNTVAQLRSFVAAARSDPRPFVLQTTFPSRELPDSETIVEAKLQNAVVVQRFT